MKKYKYYIIVYTDGSNGFAACTEEHFKKYYMSRIPGEIQGYYKYNTEHEALHKFSTLK